jgi:hypothetical protein
MNILLNCLASRNSGSVWGGHKGYGRPAGGLVCYLKKRKNDQTPPGSILSQLVPLYTLENPAGGVCGDTPRLDVGSFCLQEGSDHPTGGGLDTPPRLDFLKSSLQERPDHPTGRLVLRSFRYRLRVVLGSLWGRSGVVLGSFWGRSGVVLGSFWGGSGVVLGSF